MDLPEPILSPQNCMLTGDRWIRKDEVRSGAVRSPAEPDLDRFHSAGRKGKDQPPPALRVQNETGAHRHGTRTLSREPQNGNGSAIPRGFHGSTRQTEPDPGSAQRGDRHDENSREESENEVGQVLPGLRGVA